MTEEHLTFAQIEDYAAKKLPAEQIPALHEHAENCSACRAMLMATVAADGAEHLTDQQAVEFVAGLLPGDERRKVAEHVASCASCTGMVADLEQFRRSGAGLRSHPRTLAWALPIAAALLMVAGASMWLVTRHHAVGEPKIVAQLGDAGGLMRVTESGSVMAAASLPPGASGLIAGVMKSGHLPLGPADLSTESRETLRSSDSGLSRRPVLKVISPVGIRVISDRPEFRWSPLPGAWSWQVTVFDRDFNEIARSGVIHDTAWVPDAPLPRLQQLLWQVTALAKGVRITAPAPPEVSAVFEIVSEDTATQISQALAVRPPSHLLLAILYSQAGLRREAAVEAAAIAALNPGSAIAASLQKDLARQ